MCGIILCEPPRSRLVAATKSKPIPEQVAKSFKANTKKASMCVAAYSVSDSEREYRWRYLVKLREDWLRNAPAVASAKGWPSSLFAGARASESDYMLGADALL